MTCDVLTTLAPPEARLWASGARASGKTIGLVPTMGALHAGHLSLVRRAVAENDLACVSVFVNPLQFDDATDFERYPRDLDADTAKLRDAGCAMVFAGTLDSFFPEASSPEEIELCDPGPASIGLEGEHRPGHFEGVATIVWRLFDVVHPAVAYFGEKDYQQTLVVRHIAGETRIQVCPTAREQDGLAMSSRNALLDPAARARATCLWRGLSAARDAWRQGEREAEALTRALRAPLDIPGVEVEYAELRSASDWGPNAAADEQRAPRALVAANIGGVRLIDNLALDAEDPR